MNKIEIALEIALSAHSGQVDKGGKPYILHPLRLMLQLEDEIDMISALLHDVLEDSHYTPDKLEELGIPEKAIEVISYLTRKKNETYEKFIKRAGSDRRAKQIKKLDIEDNMNISRIDNITQKDLDRLNKYHAALKYLDSV